MVDLAERDVPLAQAICQGVMREPRVVFFARETLLLSGGDDLAVDDKGCSAVVIERGQSENSHALGSLDLKDCVDERRDGGAFSENDQTTEKKHHNENGYQPI